MQILADNNRAESEDDDALEVEEEQDVGRVVLQLTHTLAYAYVELIASPTRTFLLVANILFHFQHQIVTAARRVMTRYRLALATCQMGIQILFGQVPNAENVIENEEDLLERHISLRAMEMVFDNVEHFLNHGAVLLDEKIVSYTQRTSGFRVVRIISLHLVLIRKTDLPARTGHPSSFIPTPVVLRAKKAIINIRNENDDNCFLYSILCHLHFDEIAHNHGRVSKYMDLLHTLRYGHMPMRIIDIPKFERQNNLFINVLRWHTKPLDVPQMDEWRVTSTENPYTSVEYHSRRWEYADDDDDASIINLLLLEDNGRSHYTLIRNIDRLLNFNARNASAGITTTSINHRRRCPRCFRVFYTHHGSYAYEMHKPLCLHFLKYGPGLLITPPNMFHEFDQWHKTVAPLYIVYADFESNLVRNEDDNDHHSNIIQTHLPSMAAYLFLPNPPDDDEDECQFLPRKYEVFYGPNCIYEFLCSLEARVIEIKAWNNSLLSKAVIYGRAERRAFHSASYCYMCKKTFSTTDKAKCKVRDHCHFTGKYLGAAHSDCNMQRRRHPFLPVLFHNLRKYDMHHIMKHAVHKLPHWRCEPVAQTGETYLTMMCKIPKAINLRFIDSLQYLNC